MASRGSVGRGKIDVERVVTGLGLRELLVDKRVSDVICKEVVSRLDVAERRRTAEPAIVEVCWRFGRRIEPRRNAGLTFRNSSSTWDLYVLWSRTCRWWKTVIDVTIVGSR